MYPDVMITVALEKGGQERKEDTRSTDLIGFLAGTARLLYLDYDHVSISIDKKEASAFAGIASQRITSLEARIVQNT